VITRDTHSPDTPDGVCGIHLPYSSLDAPDGLSVPTREEVCPPHSAHPRCTMGDQRGVRPVRPMPLTVLWETREASARPRGERDLGHTGVQACSMVEAMHRMPPEARAASGTYVGELWGDKN
jgi:hypothetical protein